MNYIYTVIIVVASFQVSSWTLGPCSVPQSFITRISSDTVFQDTCRQCANTVYLQAKSSEWLLQYSGDCKIIMAVKRDSTLMIQP